LSDQLIYGDRTFNLEEDVATKVRNQLDIISKSPNGVGLLQFAVGTEGYTLFVGAGLPVMLRHCGDYDATASIG